jgi:hypothetical protein
MLLEHGVSSVDFGDDAFRELMFVRVPEDFEGSSVKCPG